MNSSIVVGVLDISQAIKDPVAADFFRGLTLSWLRYGYREVIYESSSIDALVAMAIQAQADYCFILPYGLIVSEQWRVDDVAGTDFFDSLLHWCQTHDFHIAGDLPSDGQAAGCKLVDLAAHGRMGCPPLATLPATSWDSNLSTGLLNLNPSHPALWEAWSRYRGDGVSEYLREDHQDELTSDQHLFLSVVARQATHARNGVFLWNIEPYDDIESPANHFPGSISTLYSVAAGFKPNRILETHRFSDRTKVVYFDYSQAALDVKKFMIEHWDGDDFPRLVNQLFEIFPHPETFYQLWGDVTPQTVQHEDIQRVWQRELARWEGSERFQEHWQRYRKLEHQFVCCDLLSYPSPLLDQMQTEPSAVVWWSNAFFTMYGNWRCRVEDRQASYERWIEQLAQRNPDLYLVGSDFNNTCVNDVKVGEYWQDYGLANVDFLNPYKRHRTVIRM